MYVRVPKLLSEEQLKAVDRVMETATFVDGKTTGGPAIQDIKNNLQLDRDNAGEVEGLSEADNMILQVLWNNPTVRGAVLPKRIMAPYYAKYTEGMEYGAHVDNPIMGSNPPIRTDVSMTIFLSEPDSYEGGELIVKSDVGDAALKLPRGDAIVYPTGAIHAVNKITKGERRAVITWMQSMIADPYRRRMVYELDMVCQSLFQKMPHTEEHRILMRTYGNLLRLWGEL